MSVAALQRQWEQQAELNKLIGIEEVAERPARKRNSLSPAVRGQIAASMRQRWTTRRKAEVKTGPTPPGQRKLPVSGAK
jgi:hypothetical protein